VTFRLNDAVPKSAVERWRSEQAEFLRHHRVARAEDLQVKDLRHYRRIFGRQLQRTLDQGMGSCLLRDPAIGEIVRNALLHFDRDRYRIGDFVIMPNHVHLLVEPLEEMEKILHSWKSFTAKAINKRIGKVGQLWQRESYDHIVRNRRELERMIAYIVENPSKAGLSLARGLMFEAAWEFEEK